MSVINFIHTTEFRAMIDDLARTDAARDVKASSATIKLAMNKFMSYNSFTFAYDVVRTLLEDMRTKTPENDARMRIICAFLQDGHYMESSDSAKTHLDLALETSRGTPYFNEVVREALKSRDDWNLRDLRVIVNDVDVMAPLVMFIGDRILTQHMDGELDEWFVEPVIWRRHNTSMYFASRHVVVRDGRVFINGKTRISSMNPRKRKQ